MSLLKPCTVACAVLILTSCAASKIQAQGPASPLTSDTDSGPTVSAPPSPVGKILPSYADGGPATPPVKSSDAPTFGPAPTITPSVGPVLASDVSAVLAKSLNLTPTGAWALVCGGRYNYLVAGSGPSGTGLLYEASGDLAGLDHSQITTLVAPDGFAGLVITTASCDTVLLADPVSGKVITYDMNTRGWR